MSCADEATNAPMGIGAGASSSSDADPIAAILQVLREQTRRRSTLQILGELHTAPWQVSSPYPPDRLSGSE
jgi:hypothetical protein